MTTIDIDLNSITKRGQIKATLAQANGPVSVGQKVLAVEPDDHVAYDATVLAIDAVTGRIMLEMDWGSERAVPRASEPMYIMVSRLAAHPVFQAELHRIEPAWELGRLSAVAS